MTLFEYIQEQLESVGICRNNVGLAELYVGKDGQRIPATYEGGEYVPVENHDYSAGLTYFRQDGPIDREDIETVPDTILSVSVPIVVVAICPREKVADNGKNAPYLLARTIDSALTGSFAIENAYGGRISSTSAETSWYEVITEEFEEVKGWEDGLCAVKISFDAEYNTFERCLYDTICELNENQ